jgi:hypothetical protein
MNELNMIRALLDEAPPSAEVIAEGRRRIAASTAGPGRPAAGRGVTGPYAPPAADPRPALGRVLRPWPAVGRVLRLRPARRVAVGAAVLGAAAALAVATLVPLGAPAAGPAHALPGRPARQFLLAMAVKAAAGPASGRYWCEQQVSGDRVLVGPHDTTLQPPWAGGPATPAGYQYAIFTRNGLRTCLEPPRPGWPGGTVGNVMQSLGARPASSADAAAWRRAGAPGSWKAWYDYTVRISAATGPQELIPDKLGWTAGQSYATLPTSPARLKAVFLAHPEYFGNNTGTPTQILADDALVVMYGPASPAVRAAAYRVLAGLPGVQMRPDVRDPAGQSGTAVWFSQAGPALSLTIVDPATSTPLATEDVAQQPVAHAPAGTVLDYTLFVSIGWTDTPPSN